MTRKDEEQILAEIKTFYPLFPNEQASPEIITTVFHKAFKERKINIINYLREIAPEPIKNKLHFTLLGLVSLAIVKEEINTSLISFFVELARNSEEIDEIISLEDCKIFQILVEADDIVSIQKLFNFMTTDKIDNMIHNWEDWALEHAIEQKYLDIVSLLIEHTPDSKKKNKMIDINCIVAARNHLPTMQILLQNITDTDKEQKFFRPEMRCLNIESIVLILANIPENISEDYIEEFYDNYCNDPNNRERDLKFVAKLREFKKTNSHKQLYRICAYEQLIRNNNFLLMTAYQLDNHLQNEQDLSEVSTKVGYQHIIDLIFAYALVDPDLPYPLTIDEKVEAVRINKVVVKQIRDEVNHQVYHKRTPMLERIFNALPSKANLSHVQRVSQNTETNRAMSLK